MKKGITPSHAQENLEGAGRAQGVSRFTTFEAVISNYGVAVGAGAVGAETATPTLDSHPPAITLFAAAS